MNKTKIIAAMAKKHGKTRKELTLLINSFLEEIQKSLVEGEKVTLSDFGTFNVSERKGFDGVDPRTNEPLKIPDRTIATFKCGKKLKQELNKEDDE